MQLRSTDRSQTASRMTGSRWESSVNSSYTVSVVGSASHPNPVASSQSRSRGRPWNGLPWLTDGGRAAPWFRVHHARTWLASQQKPHGSSGDGSICIGPYARFSLSQRPHATSASRCRKGPSSGPARSGQLGELAEAHVQSSGRNSLSCTERGQAAFRPTKDS